MMEVADLQVARIKLFGVDISVLCRHGVELTTRYASFSGRWKVC